MNPDLITKLSQLPKEPGVYFHKDKAGNIIYVGKAAILNNRVRQYFQKSRVRDPKTDALVAEIVDVDWTVVDSEAEALFLEAEMVRRYQPRYNILLRDDKSVAYVRINSKDKTPSVTITRRPLDDKADYYGPFMQVLPVKRSLKYLRKIFPYSTHTTLPSRECLQAHLGLCPAPESIDYNEAKYKENLKKLALYLTGQRMQLINDLEKEMSQASRSQDFEAAAKIRNTIRALKSLRTRIVFSDKENLDLSKDHALFEISELLNLTKPPRRIEGYDISHMNGTDNVASMVVFTNGIADKGEYRKFKMRLKGNDDFAHMNEVITRRLNKKDTKKWRLPDIILIDGGKGQLGAAINARDELNLAMPMIGLAKKFEQIVIDKKRSNVNINKEYLKKLTGYITDESDDYLRINLPETSNIIKLLQRIRDESHRFAVSYHSSLKIKRQTTSLLDDIPTIGPATRKKLIKTFGSLNGVRQARIEELISLIGEKKATIIKQYLKADINDQSDTQA